MLGCKGLRVVCVFENRYTAHYPITYHLFFLFFLGSSSVSRHSVCDCWHLWKVAALSYFLLFTIMVCED